MLGDGERGIRSLYIYVASVTVARQTNVNDKGYLSQDPLSFPQAKQR